MNHRLTTFAAALLAACATLYTTPAVAEFTEWQLYDESGDWDTANWSNGLPAEGDVVQVSGYPGARTAFGPSGVVGSFDALLVSATDAEFTLRLAEGSEVSVAQLMLGLSGRAGGLSQRGVMRVDRAYLGFDAGSSGIFRIDGVGRLEARYLYVGHGSNATGAMYSAASSQVVADWFAVAQSAGSVGEYAMVDDGPGSTLTTRRSFVGGGGIGVFQQNAGWHRVDEDLLLGYDPGTSGTYHLRQGELLTAHSFVGLSGAGTFKQTGGTHSVSHNLALGSWAGGSGDYLLDGGTLNVANIVNGAGTGKLIIDGGTLNVSGSSIDVDLLQIGLAPSSRGSYTLAAGRTQTTGSLAIGVEGIGEFQHHGGTHLITDRLSIGFLGPGGSVYAHSAGTVDAEGHIELGIEDAPSTFGTYVLSGSGELNSTTLTAGVSGRGNFKQSGGTHTSATRLTLGMFAGSAGSYHLSDGIFNVAEIVNGEGTGTLTIDGGTLKLTGTAIDVDELRLGSAPGSNGSFTLTAGQTLTTVRPSIGLEGTGQLTQTGGTHNSSGNLIVGTLGTGTGTGSYSHSGGTLNVAQILFLSMLAGSSGTYDLSGSGELVTWATTVGYNGGTGSFNQSGGTHDTGRLKIGGTSIGSGTYTMADGSLNISSEFVVGDSGSGSFDHRGGSVTAGNTLQLGDDAGSFGTYTLSGSGELTAPTIEVGGGGIGVFEQSGGSIKVGTLRLASGNGSVGLYELTGGSLEVGNITHGDGRVADLHIAGGSLNLTGTSVDVKVLRLHAGDGLSNIFELQAGQTLEADATYIDGLGSNRFKQSGGSFIAGDLYVGADHSGIYELSGGTATADTLVVGLWGNGEVYQSGGTFTVGSLALGKPAAGVPGSGHYELSGGTLAVGSISSDGVGNASFALDGGSLQVAGRFEVDHFSIGPNAAYGRSVTVNGVMRNAGRYTANAGETLTVNGSLDNRGLLALAGGTITGTGDLSNDALMTGSGTITRSGDSINDFTNNGLVQQSGGDLLLARRGVHRNNGNWVMAAGYRMGIEAADGGFHNHGSLELSGGQVSGAGSLSNQASGIISGRGTIASAFANRGALVVDAGSTTVVQAFANEATGRILVGGNSASLRGGSIGNAGLIQGLGTVNNAVDNAGLVEAVGGTLTLAGAVGNSGTLQASGGATLLISQGLASNEGVIQLAGGTVDNSGAALRNAATGKINGAGTLRSGTISNDGQLQLSGGVSSLTGDLVANSASKVILSGASNVTFYGSTEIHAGAELRVSAGSVASFFGPVLQRSGASFTGGGAKYYEAGMSVGNSPGFGHDEGDISFGEASQYLAEIGGISACTLACGGDPALRDASFDKYVVDGHLALGGTLMLVSWNGFVGQVGQRFDLLDWGSSSGSFASIDASGLQLASGARLDSSQLYSLGAVSVTAVPEPGSYAMLLAGLALVGTVLRRRQGGRRGA